MEITEIEEKVRQIKAELSSGNVFGERVFLVAATKTQSAECINAAIRGGADAVAENKVQEFREKRPGANTATGILSGICRRIR